MDERSGNENWYKNTESTNDGSAQLPDNGAAAEVEWTASEFVDRHKSANWYLVLAVVIAAITAIVYFAGHDYISTGAVVAIGIIFGIIAARKPRTLRYRLDSKGLSVADRLYPYRHFKAFSLSHEGAFASISLLPLRRFMPVMTIYCDPAAEQKITSVLADYLPLDNRPLDPIDKFLKKIRF